MAQERIRRENYKKAKESYDAIIIGAGLSGLGVGGLLAKAGKKVVILERSGETGGRARSIEQDGFIFDLGPHVVQEKGDEERLSELLGKGDEFKKKRTAMEERGIKLASYRDGNWVNMYDLIPTGPAAQKIQEAIDKVKPEDLPKYDAISVGDWIRGITKDEKMLYFTRLFSAVMCTHPEMDYMSAGTYLRLIKNPTYAPEEGGLLCYYPHRGLGSWMKMLREGAEEKGATIRTHSEVTKIIVEDNKVKGVLVEEGDRQKQIRFHGYGEIGNVKRINAPIVVTTFPIWELFKIIDKNLLPTWFVEWVEKAKDKTTAIIGFWVASKEPILKEKWFVLTVSPRTNLPFVILPLSNLAPETAPKGVHFLNQVSLCELDLKYDPEKVYDTIELLKEDMDEYYPGWRDKVIWVRPYFFDFEETTHAPAEFGVFRPGPKAPRIEGLYFTGDTVNTMKPTMEGTSESALICTKEILGKPPE